MSLRFPIFVLVLAIGLGTTGYGLFGHTETLFEKPNPKDDPANPHPDTEFEVGEIQLTDWIAKERVIRDEWYHLIDQKTEAICFS